MDDKLKAFERMCNIMDELREKCPWDKKQTMESLRTLTIEETYELTDSILSKDWNNIKKELGDLLLHIVFYSRIASEENQFTITEVLNELCEKLIYRHPHIYGDVKVENEEQVKQNWEKLKLKEGKKSVLEGIPHSMPSFVKAIRIQDKVKQVGFEFENTHQIFDKIEEELIELKEAIQQNDIINTEEELGDFIFSVINLSRFIKVNADNALEKTNLKFMNRFKKMEKLIQQENKQIQNLTLKEMDEFWIQAKK